MTAVPVAFRSAEGKYKFLGTTQLVNAYAEQMGQDGKGSMAVLPCEGLVSFTDTESGPCRGMIFMDDLDRGYSIHSSGAYRIDDGSNTRIGTVPGIDAVELSRNQKEDPQIVVQSASGNQVIESDSLSYVTDTDLPSGVTTACNAGNRTMYGYADGTYFFSEINTSKIIDSGLSFSTFDSQAGKLVRIVQERGELLGFMSTFTDVHNKNRGADAADEPFVYTATIQRGLKAPGAITKCDNTLMWAADDNNVHRLVDYTTKVISTNEVSRLIQNDPDPDSITAFSYERDGHAFAVFSGTDWTRTYDAATGVWHSRKSYGYDRWRAVYSMRGFGKTLFGDRLSGKLLRADKDTFTEDGQTMVWQVISPPMHAFPNGGIVNALHLDMATGYGSLGATPKVMVETSTDGGNTFTQYREVSLGTPGQYQARVTTRRLGRFGPKGMVLRISVSDPQARALVGVDVDVKPLKR